MTLRGVIIHLNCQIFGSIDVFIHFSYETNLIQWIFIIMYKSRRFIIIISL